MSKKVRIHDLAKKYGMSGKDMASKLRDMGFSQAKSHMSALDEFELLQAEGLLQAHGIPVVGGGPENEESSLQSGGLVLRKKKKKKKADDDGDSGSAAVATPESDPDPEPTPATPALEDLPTPEASEPESTEREAENVPPTAATVETSGEPSAQEEPDAADEPVQAAEAGAAEARSAATAEQPSVPEPEVAAASTAPTPSAPRSEATQVDTTSEATSVEPEAAPERAAPPIEPKAADEPQPELSEAPSAAAKDVEQAETKAEPAAAEEPVSTPQAKANEPTAPTQAPAETQARSRTEQDGNLTVKKTKKESPASGEGDDKKQGKPRGNVVGFIDPSSFQSSQPARRKNESRRLSSRDDVAPDVRPTFSHDRGGRMRGGGGTGSRGALTASQLRERESGRFLRRNRPAGQAGGKGGRGGGPSRSSGPRRNVTESPMAGSTVELQAPLTLGKLAEGLKLKANVVLKTALQEGIGFLNINAALDEETAILLADAFDVELSVTQEVAAEEALLEDLKAKRSAVEDDDLIVRPPCVAFLGHVDHGKTTLIDQIRSSRMAEGESGGITQHIGAYQVETQLGHKVTIIDTPGHAAFTAMRARGAKAVDLVVLVVAGDDGVKPHTEEALNHARAAETPVVVAITKADKPGFDASKTMQQLTAIGLNPEEWGGETAMIQVSGITGQGVEDLLERVFLEGEVLELKAHPDGTASGVVLEAEKQQGKGIVAHLLVQDGTLRPGNVILAGEGYGKVRSINDDRGQVIEHAGPSMPVEVTGLDALPGVGDAFHVVEKLAKAKEVALERERNNRAISMAEKRSPSANLAAILGKEPATERTQINLIVRADVQGSAEVIKHTLAELDHPRSRSSCSTWASDRSPKATWTWPSLRRPPCSPSTWESTARPASKPSAMASPSCASR